MIHYLSFRKLPYWTLVRKICPSKLDFKSTNKTSIKRASLTYRTMKKKSLTDPFNEVTPRLKIYLFIKRVLKKLLPYSVFGNDSNLNTFLGHVKTFLVKTTLRGNLSSAFMCSSIKTKAIPWIKTFSENERNKVLEITIDFLIRKIVIPLIHSFFHLSWTRSQKFKLLFTRKKSWNRHMQRSCQRFIKTNNLTKITKQTAEQMHISGQSLGVSRVRFLLKKTYLRPIANMSHKKDGASSINDKLEHLATVLTYWKYKNKDFVGSTIFSLSEMHSRWKQFCSYYKSKEGKRNFYFVTTDVDNCFDTIDNKVLFELVSKILELHEKYTIYRYMTTTHRGWSTYETTTTPPEEKRLENSNVSLIRKTVVTTKELVNILKAHLFGNVLVIGKQFYRQGQGISQGSKISSLLCSFYYGNMDSSKLRTFWMKPNFLVRFVDNIFFVSPSLTVASTFLNLMLDGVPGYNCYCKSSKTMVSFKFVHPRYGIIQSFETGQPVSFFGIAINRETLSVSPDFSNFSGLNTEDTLSTKLAKNCGENLARMLLSNLQPKSYSMVFDADLNSKTIIERNISLIFLFIALKFHCFVKRLPVSQRVAKNAPFFCNLIKSLPQQLKQIIAAKLKKSVTFVKLPLRKLCFEAFLYILEQHSEMYQLLIKKLRMEFTQDHRNAKKSLNKLTKLRTQIPL